MCMEKKASVLQKTLHEEVLATVIPKRFDFFYSANETDGKNEYCQQFSNEKAAVVNMYSLIQEQSYCCLESKSLKKSTKPMLIIGKHLCQ